MILQRENDSITISINTANIDMKTLEVFIQYLRHVEILAQNKGTEEQAFELSETVKQSWWEKNKQQFLAQ